MMNRNRMSSRKRSMTFEIEPHVAKEIWAVMYTALGLLLYLSISGKLGVVGDVMQGVLMPIFGWGVYGLPILCFLIAIIFFFNKRSSFGLERILGVFLLVISASTLVHLSVPADDIYNVAVSGEFGGYIGFTGTFIGTAVFGSTGAYIVFGAFLIISLLLTLHVTIVEIFGALSFLWTRKRVTAFKKTSKSQPKNRTDEDLDDLSVNIIKPEMTRRPVSEDVDDDASMIRLRRVEPSSSEAHSRDEEFRDEPLAHETEETSVRKSMADIEWEYPALDLLNDDNSQIVVDDLFLKRSAELIRDKLAQFDIEVLMQDIHVGPTVVQYTLKPHEGVKLSKITTLKNDLALALSARAIRIEAPIPGKGLVGIEVPNDTRAQVYLKELLHSEEYETMHSRLRLCLGRNVSGNPVVVDLGKMPHLLIAGATGSGKSVGMNSFLISLLYQNSPAEMNFIMIDPKRVELNSYNNIPHLLTPVITDPDKAATALRWAVAEMGRRYQFCADSRHRNIKDYNADITIEEKMPFLVIVIDELADLMMSSSKEVEASICRVAQMGRAVGMHLMIATQRPSVDVITGLIKANIPARVAFTVSSSIDSRVILDCLGAEDLLGQGDMLYLAGDVAKPVRVQGVYVDSKEIERVTNRIKLSNVDPQFVDEITSHETAKMKVPGVPGGKSIAGDDVDDDMYDEAVTLVIEMGKASASLLQRRLKLGYARSARLLDIMEEKGVVGPARGAKPREIYIGRQ